MFLYDLLKQSLGYKNDWTISSENPRYEKSKRFALMICYDSETETSDYILIHFPLNDNRFSNEHNTDKHMKAAIEVYNENFNENGGDPIPLTQKEIDQIWPAIGHVMTQKGDKTVTDDRFYVARNIAAT